MLEQYIRDRKRQRELLLMTHIVIGYPSLSASLELVDAMVESGVDIMELQIPFSEPIADGPVILHANQQSLASGIRVDQCLEFAETVARKHPIPFLFMSYYNVLFVRGVERFIREMSQVGIRGSIVPDLPPEEADVYLQAMTQQGLDPIFIYSPNTSEQRMREIAAHATGFIYCVARKGVTGKNTSFSVELAQYLGRCRQATALPLAVGFGVRNKEDISYLRGKVDIAVVGSETLRILDSDGVAGVPPFIRGLVASPAQ
ncbi:MAG TPA: tryptophan synthase subunit alpha [Polyangiaceae bacterium]|nr:tryptophan synthase subunit alpha [Polyangiaceae bacterium]